MGGKRDKDTLISMGENVTGDCFPKFFRTTPERSSLTSVCHVDLIFKRGNTCYFATKNEKTRSKSSYCETFEFNIEIRFTLIIYADVAIFLAKLGYVGISVDLYKSTKAYPRSKSYTRVISTDRHLTSCRSARVSIA